MEDTKTKVTNAISDKQSRLDQYNTEISKVNKQLEDESNKLSSLEDLKKKAEAQSLPNSRAL